MVLELWTALYLFGSGNVGFAGRHRGAVLSLLVAHAFLAIACDTYQ